MPNRDTHVPFSTAVGGGYAALRSDTDDTLSLLLEALGGCIGGYIGARMPDIIDPPTSPNHRGIGHGVLSVGTVAAKCWGPLQRTIQEGHAYADAQLEQHRQTQEPGAAIAALLCRLGTGALNGFVAGYVGHLVLDAGTKRGLPLC